MPRLVTAFAVAALLIGGLARAEAGIVVTVDKSAQRLSVAVDGSPATLGRCRPRARLSHAQRHLPAGAARAQMVLAQIRLVADALFDLLQRRLRHPRFLRDLAYRPAGLARLHPPASQECRRAVRAGAGAYGATPRSWSPARGRRRCGRRSGIESAARGRYRQPCGRRRRRSRICSEAARFHPGYAARPSAGGGRLPFVKDG